MAAVRRRRSGSAGAERPRQQRLVVVSGAGHRQRAQQLAQVVIAIDAVDLAGLQQRVQVRGKRSIGTRPNAELINTMLDAAVDKIAEIGERPVVHSDRGGHYRWPGWLTRIADAKLARSMSRKGCSPDNAACEGFFGRLKIEMFFSRDWLRTTIEEFVAALDAYIRWYNETRIKISLGGLSPAAHRRSLGIAV